jgi:hypothetical protein
MARTALILALLGPWMATAEPVSAINSEMRPITKVVTLLGEMKAQTEKEAAEDLAAYDKYNCWCETNEKEKTEAIAAGEQRIAELAAFIEESAAKQAELKTEIESLTSDIAEDNTALEEATGVRAKEHGDFLTEEADIKETRSLLKEASSVLSKVQLLQKPGAAGAADAQARKAAAEALIQVNNIVKQRFPKFQNVMQQDLFDVLGSLKGMSSFLSKRTGVALDQKRLLPWEKTEEEIGMEKNPNELKGAASGVKSYNSRSGRILGILDEMHDEFSKDLGTAQQTDFTAEVSFQKLRAAKLAEIATATAQKNLKEEQLADSLYKAAKAKENKEKTFNAMTEDQKFLTEVLRLCKIATEEYNGRVKVRSEEIRALGEALTILTADEARDNFGKTMSFIQVDSNREVSAAKRAAAEDRAAERAMQRLAKVAQKHRNWAIASLAMRVRLDAFTKVKAAMDKMLAELKKQQADEYAKWELCQKDIDTTEDSIKVGENTKEDLQNKHTELTNTIATLKTNIEMLKKEIAEMEVSLKQAGEQRHNENELYQTSVMDQRATVNILGKALTRLETFYSTNTSLIEVGAHGHSNRGSSKYYPPPPDMPADYTRSSKAGGVLQLLHTIIKDAEIVEQDLTMSEQKAQEDYASFVKITTETIESDRAAVQEKMGQVASNSAALSETEEAQLANDANIAELNDVLKAYHMDCDYILKYFDVRQKARAEEMDAIVDAKAILSGADFA